MLWKVIYLTASGSPETRLIHRCRALRAQRHGVRRRLAGCIMKLSARGDQIVRLLPELASALEQEVDVLRHDPRNRPPAGGSRQAAEQTI